MALRQVDIPEKLDFAGGRQDHPERLDYGAEKQEHPGRLDYGGERQDLPEKVEYVAGSDTNASSDYDKSYAEHRGVDKSAPGSYDPIIDRYTEEEVKKVIRKVDRRLIPLCGLMYCVSLLDRTNLSNAAIAG